MSIREATKEDIAEVRELVVSLARHYLRADRLNMPDWLAETLTAEQFLNRIASAEFTNRVVLMDGKLVGYISMKDNGHLYHLFVAEQYQGRGIARSLWESVTGRSFCGSYVVRSSLGAVAVYQRFGFIRSGAVAERDGVQFQPMALSLVERQRNSEPF